MSQAYTRDAPEVRPPILFCWPTTSDVDVGEMAVGVEASHQYPAAFCCHATGGYNLPNSLDRHKNIFHLLQILLDLFVQSCTKIQKQLYKVHAMIYEGKHYL